MAFSIGGLVSGLDTATMIDQLMQLEARPQMLLKNKVSGTQSLVAALQQLNTRVSSLGTLAEKTAKTNALDIYTATSSSEKVAVTTGERASAGAIGLEVVQVAKAQVSVSALVSAWPEDATVLTIALKDGQVSVDTDGKNLDQVVTAINESGSGVTAMKVAAGTDPDTGEALYRLQFSARDTGSDGAFGITTTNADGTTTDLLAEPGAVQIRAAQDAQLKLWAGTGAEQTVSSSSNTFDDVLQGVGITLAADTPAGEKTSVAVTRDDQAVTARAKELVDGLTSLLSFISKNSSVSVNTSSGSTQTSGGIFTGDSSVRDIEQRLLTAATSPVEGRSPSEIGISITKDGSIEFDADKFGKALAEDSAWAERVVQEIAGRVATAATDASDKYDGAITLRIQGQESLVRNLNDQVTDWDTRLASRRATLERTWAQLEVTLNNLQSQGDYLTSQLASLPAWGSKGDK